MATRNPATPFPPSPRRRGPLAILLFCAVTFGAWEAFADDERVLSQGVSVEREISGEQTHTYLFSLAAGQFVHAYIQQTGIEVVASLIGPDGRKLEDFAESAGDHGVREILFLAQSDGPHRLVVRPYKKTFPLVRYVIQLDAQRSATRDDELRLQALRIAKDAGQFIWTAKPISAEEAEKIAAKYQESIRIWESLNDSRMIAECLLDLGLLNNRIGEPARARELFERALPLFPPTAIGTTPKASTLNNLADSYYRFGEVEKSLDFFRQSLALKKPGRSRAISLDNLGAIYSRLGEYQLALDHHQEALTLFRERGLIRDEAVALNNLANVWGRIGDLRRALEYISQALARIRETGDKLEEAGYLYNAGNFHFGLGNHAEALECARQSLTISRALKSSRDEADGLTLLCKIEFAMGETERAQENCDRSVAMHRANRDRLSEAMALSSISLIHQKKGDRQRAIESREAALAIYHAAGDPFGTLTAEHALGGLAMEGGDLAAARVRFERAIEISESLRVKAGSHLVRSTSWVGSQKVYEGYIDLLMRMHEREPAEGHDRTALQILERARARSLLDMLAEARVRIRQGADPSLLETERALLRRLNAKDAAWKRFRGAERTKAQAEALAAEINDVTTQLQLLEERIRASSPRYAQLTRPQPITAEEIQEQLLDSETVLLEFALGREKSRLWAVTPGAISTFPLASEREIETAARQLYDVLTARQPKSELAEAEQLARIRAADAKWESAARRLSDLLLTPVADRLRGEWRGKRLVIVGPGALEYLPFAALPVPGSPVDSAPLIADHEIVNLPSATILSFIRRESANRTKRPEMLAILADPVFEISDPRIAAERKRTGDPANPALLAKVRSAASPPALPGDLARSARSFIRDGFGRLLFSREEADAIEKLAPGRPILKATGFAANHELAAGGRLGRYRIVHFATHGLINTEHPGLSGLVLSLVDRDGLPQDGFLRLHEIYNLDLPADLVVLSACQTALGREVKGEGLVGLTRGFMHAGAERVVASLWQIDDHATAELM
ncbi:MAG: CHAT domain-containing tetratricopeptide repeat protein, partial [Blastocatellia bacterium]